MPGWRIGDWSVDRAANEIRRGEERVRLEPKVADLLVALAERADRVVGRDELLAQLWSGGVVGEDVLTQAVIKLRKALGDTSKEPVYIRTIPKRGYRLIAPVRRIDGEPAAPAPRRRRPGAWIAGAAALVVAALAGGTLYLRDAPDADVRALAESVTEPRAGALPKVIVQAFEGAAGDPVQERLARGITARLITDLGRFPEVRVVALQTRGDAPAGDYVVRGEVQRSGEKIRLFVRLSEAASGESLWSAHYDRAYGELFALQDELTREVLAKLRITVGDAELRRRARPYTTNLRAYEYFLRAQSGLLVRRKAENDAAREMYLKAIELDPAFARARAGLALTYAAERRNGWTADAAAALARAVALARSAREMDPDIPENRFALAFVHMERGELAQATDELRSALRLNPSYADAYALLAGIETYRGRPRETIPLIRAAMRLRPESGHLYFMILGRAYYFLGDDESAARALRQALQRNVESLESHVYLAATLARAGRRDEAAWEAEQIRALEPAFGIRAWLASYPMAHAGQREALTRALEALEL